MRIQSIVGTRPNFVKVAPSWPNYSARRQLALIYSCTLVRTTTGSYPMYSWRSSECQLLTTLLEVGSAGHAVQTARVMERHEPVLEDEQPDLVIVPGDVNSTFAAAVVAAKLHIPSSFVISGGCRCWS